MLSFKMEAARLVGFFVLFILGPLVMFTPQLSRSKRRGLGEYGLLASRYVQGFEEKWVHGEKEEGALNFWAAATFSRWPISETAIPLFGICVVLFGLEDIARLAAAPRLYLGLTILSLEELIVRLV